MVGHNVPEDRRARITVKPFFDLCGISSPRRGAGREKYGVLRRHRFRAGARVGDVPEKEKYDVILLDEGQDFSPAMFRIVLSLRRPERDDVMIAMDTEQDLYGRFSLKEMGIDFRGRTHMLPSSYRSTQQIFEFAHRLAGRSFHGGGPRTGQMFVFPSMPEGRFGPRYGNVPDPDRLVSHLVKELGITSRQRRFHLLRSGFCICRREGLPRRPWVPQARAGKEPFNRSNSSRES